MKKNVIRGIILGVMIFAIGIFIVKFYQPSSYHPTTFENITMSIKEKTLTRSGMTLVITDLSKEKNAYGEDFIIEKKIGNYWKTLNQDEWFNTPAYYVDENGHLELSVSWEKSLGKLKNGTYRLLKEVNGKYLAVEFKIQ